jgi:PAS domain S-box-containing protein
VSNQLDRGAHSGDVMTALAKKREWSLIVPLFAPFVALTLQLLLWPLIDPYVWFLFYPAVFVSSWMGGFGAGLKASAISVALVFYFFVPPEHSFVGKDVKQLFPASVFLGMGVMFAILHDRLRTANQQVAESLAASKTAIEKLHEAHTLSERLRSEQSAELAAILDSVPMPVFTAHDPDCLHITGNRAADQLLRNLRGAEASLSAREQFKPRHFRAFKDDRELNNDELPAQRAARGIAVHDFEFSLVFDDGTSREMLAYATPLWSDAHQVRGAINVLVDITELKHAMKALQAREAQLQSFVQQAPASIAMFDQNMVCLAASHHWTNSFGRGRSELVGLNHYDVHPDLPEHWKVIHQRGRAGEFLSNDEDLWIQADGSQVWLSWAVLPWVDADGKIGGIMIMTDDITRRKQAEQALRDQEVLARSVLDSLIAQVAGQRRLGAVWQRERFGRTCACGCRHELPRSLPKGGRSG